MVVARLGSHLCRAVAQDCSKLDIPIAPVVDMHAVSLVQPSVHPGTAVI